MLMAQANKPIAILRKRILRLFNTKAFAFFKFIMFDYIIMNNGYENFGAHGRMQRCSNNFEDSRYNIFLINPFIDSLQSLCFLPESPFLFLEE